MVMYKIANFIIKVRFLFTSMMYYLSKIMLLCVKLVNNLTWYLPSFNHNKKTLPINVPNIAVNNIIIENNAIINNVFSPKSTKKFWGGILDDYENNPILFSEIKFNPLTLNLTIEKQFMWTKLSCNFFRTDENSLNVRRAFADQVSYKHPVITEGFRMNNNINRFDVFLMKNLSKNSCFNLKYGDIFIANSRKKFSVDQLRLIEVYYKNNRFSNEILLSKKEIFQPNPSLTASQAENLNTFFTQKRLDVLSFNISLEHRSYKEKYPIPALSDNMFHDCFIEGIYVNTVYRVYDSNYNFCEVIKYFIE